MIAPIPTPSIAQAARQYPAITTAPGTRGSASDRPGCPPRAISAWVSQKQPNASTSPTTSAAPPVTAALAASTVHRRGTATKVVRIRPVEYSEVNTSTPSTVTGSAAYSAYPRKLLTRGSSGPPARAVLRVAPTIAVIPRVTTAEISTVNWVERTDRSLVHSKASTSAARASGSEPLRGGVWVRVTVTVRPCVPASRRRPGSRRCWR